MHWIGVSDWALPAGQIHVVASVAAEIRRLAPAALDDNRLLLVSDPTEFPEVLWGWTLDSGELAAIGYALKHSARGDLVVLCDERAARKACSALGLTVTGTLGLLVDAVEAGRVHSAAALDALDRLPGEGRMHLAKAVQEAVRETLESLVTDSGRRPED